MPKPNVRAPVRNIPAADTPSATLLLAIKWFDPKQGYGFFDYQPNDDVFFHVEALYQGGLTKDVKPGDILSVTFVRGDKGLIATKLASMFPSFNGSSPQAPVTRAGSWQKPPLSNKKL